MFTTPEQVSELTNGSYTVTTDEIVAAQAIIESFVGRIETSVDSPDDLALLARATAYQAAYMSVNSETVYEQIRLEALNNFGQSIRFKSTDEASPYVAPLAILTCKNLSWKRSRTIKTGSIFGPLPVRSWWTE